MHRRKFVIGTGAVVSGVSAAMGAGAFSKVKAKRGVSVSTASDAKAYLKLTAKRDDIISDDGQTGTLSLDLGNPTTAEGGKGFNNNAITKIKKVFEITNQGTKTVKVEFEDDKLQDGVHFWLDDKYAKLDPGESVCVNVKVDTMKHNPHKNNGSLLIEAEAV